MINGISNGIELPDVVMANILGGMFGGPSYLRESITWPQQARPVTGAYSLRLGESVSIGADNLDAVIKDALKQLRPGEHVTIVGLSAGALVANEELRRLLADPDAPDKSKLNFVVVADSSRSTFNMNRYDKILDFTYTTPAVTKYDTTVVTAEYDGFADFPDRWWNAVAVVNAYAGQIVAHVPSAFTDLSTVPTKNITVKVNSLGGVTTSYFVSADQLPLVTLLPFLGPQEVQLKETIDRAYARNDGKSAATVSATAVQAANATELVPAPEIAPAPSAPAETVAAQTVHVAEPVAEADVATAPTPTAPSRTHRTPAPAAATSDLPIAGRTAAVTGSERSGTSRRSSVGAVKAAAARTAKRAAP